jgi:hypothetical protein
VGWGETAPAAGSPSTQSLGGGRQGLSLAFKMDKKLTAGSYTTIQICHVNQFVLSSDVFCTGAYKYTRQEREADREGERERERTKVLKYT